MEEKISFNNIYMPSKDVVAREVQGEFILVPITSGIGDLEDELFTLNETGRAIWEQLDGKKNLKDIANNLALDYDISIGEIEKDIIGITEELCKRKMLVKVKRD